MREVITDSEEKTKKLAESYIKKLRVGDVIALSGSLGSGKTTFIKGVAKGLNVKEFVKSPTFNLLHIYHGKLPLYHFDFYRLEEKDCEELGFDEYFDKPDGITVVEWADKIKKELPDNAKWVKMSYVSEKKRKIRFIK
jgi:tRNA threonylcarbamoyladenosine biosynthesis protein TsaE